MFGISTSLSTSDQMLTAEQCVSHRDTMWQHTLHLLHLCILHSIAQIKTVTNH